jgi:hypothetical protein
MEATLRVRAFLVVPLVATAASCRSQTDVPADEACLTAVGGAELIATYRSSSSAGTAADDHRWRYWRSPNRIAFEHPEPGVVEVWSRYPNGELAFERWFTDAGRAVTYTSGELRSVGRDGGWAAQTAIVPPAVMGVLASHGKASFRCLAAERRAGELHGRRYRLTWLPALELPAELVVTTASGEHRLVLEALSGANELEEAFARGLSLDRLDFADVGDNEADPFIAKLIAQGFVEHPEDHAGGR